MDFNSVLERFRPYLGDNDQNFLSRVFNVDQNIYRKRLETIGFSGKRSVLDAGCGFGQWSLQLSKLNTAVVSCDVAPHRLIILETLCAIAQSPNVRIRYSNLEALPFEDASFDAIFCYGAVFTANVETVLKEFYRVLEPGGLCYVTFNGIGYAVDLWMRERNSTSDFSPKKSVAHSLMNTVYQASGLHMVDGQMLFEPKEAQNLCERLGFQVVSLAGEGKTIMKRSSEEIFSFYSEKYFGLPGVFEILAQK